MKILNKLLLTAVFGALAAGAAFAQTSSGGGEQIITFRFLPGEDMFYIPFGGNDAELNRLYSLVDEYRAEIVNGKMPVYVDGYCASLPTEQENRHTAFVRANRVKSELITNKGLAEDNFITKNYTATYTGVGGVSHKDMVVVTLRIPAREEPRRPEPVREEPKREEPPTAAEQKPESVVERQPVIVEPAPRYSRWSVGASVGLPFFWGDMTSTSGDKTYIGVMAGVQATYQISPMFGVTLTLDWAQNKAGSRGYAKGYLLDASGMTWYTPQSFATQEYGDLYSKINMYSAGLHLDVNVNRLFGPRIANSRLKLIVSPAVYAQHFSSKVYTKSDDKIYVGERLSKDLSLGLGGDVALRYNVSPTIDLQLKGTGVWITDNLFDNIRTVGYVKQNAMWGVSAGVVWKIGGSRDANLLHRKK